ncbi:hypothetical protein Vspart_00676 [Vibrio spartinae]|uniref:Uncharacterized protein n=1 Tax=Vibrio spartinae TaxID=1918945 RepID=A0ABX6QWG5_9VIBR|nr:hypothetical protein Vspart_00676 [Vibrio spartinae]
MIQFSGDETDGLYNLSSGEESQSSQQMRSTSCFSDVLAALKDQLSPI